MKPSCIQLAVTLVTCLYCNTIQAADWTSFLNGPHRTGYSDANLSPELKLAWVYRTRQNRRRPGRVHGKHRSRVMRCGIVSISIRRCKWPFVTIDFTSVTRSIKNSIAWTRRRGNPFGVFIRKAPFVWLLRWLTTAFTFGSDDGHVYCLDQQDGHEVWRMRQLVRRTTACWLAAK